MMNQEEQVESTSCRLASMSSLPSDCLFQIQCCPLVQQVSPGHVPEIAVETQWNPSKYQEQWASGANVYHKGASLYLQMWLRLLVTSLLISHPNNSASRACCKAMFSNLSSAFPKAWDRYHIDMSISTSRNLANLHQILTYPDGCFGRLLEIAQNSNVFFWTLRRFTIVSGKTVNPYCCAPRNSKALVHSANPKAEIVELQVTMSGLSLAR